MPRALQSIVLYTACSCHTVGSLCSFFRLELSLCLPAHSSWCHISRGDFQNILWCATFHAVISRTFFVVPHFTRRFPARSLWCHISRGDFQKILCRATFHAVIFQHILSGATFYTSPRIPYNLSVLLIIYAFLLIPAPRLSCYLCFATCRPALCLGVSFNSMSNCCTLTYRSLSPFFTMLLYVI
jgi:hypothetical protein